jgi:hypothetical protein
MKLYKDTVIFITESAIKQYNLTLKDYDFSFSLPMYFTPIDFKSTNNLLYVLARFEVYID